MAKSIPSFGEATRVRQTSSHTYTADLRDEWCIGSVPHGGYVTSVFQRVAREHFTTTLAKQQQPHLLSMHLEFVRRTSTGGADFTVSDVKLGRQTSTVHITLSQGDRVEVLAYATHTNLAKEEGLSFDTKWSLQPPRLVADPKLLDTDSDPNWTLVKHMPYSNFRRASSRVDWILPRRGPINDGAAFADEWLRFNTVGSDGRRERFDDVSIGYLSDMWPQLVEQHLNPSSYDMSASPEEAVKNKGRGSRFWFPTLLLNLDIKKALPPEGVDYLFLRVLTKQVRKGRYDIEVFILDEQGELVALSHHVAFALDASRNLASRSGSASKI